MKFVFVVILTLLAGNFQPNANPQKTFSSIEKAINAGDSKGIVAHIHDHLLLDINNKEVAYSRSQSEQILRDFFKNNKPISFDVTYRGSEALLGTLKTQNNKKFRVSLKLKVAGATYHLEQLSISEQ
jgi:hypothetical protein